MLMQKWAWTYSLYLHFATIASFIYEYAHADVDVRCKQAFMCQ